MPSDSEENRRLSKALNITGAPPPEQEQIPCPRCDSTNTKFCYYNNYNFSQPRHFCKGCRRYWTQGGTLRDIPIGGGTRKNAKRSRTATTTTPATTTTTTTNTSHNNFPLPATPVLLPISPNHGSFGNIGGLSTKGNGAVSGTGTLCGSFSSLLNNGNQGHGHGFLALGGFGVGIDPGFEDVGFGLGRGMWPFSGMGDGATGVVGNNGGTSTGMGNTWQFEGGETGFVGGDCFSWPDLAISTPGNGLK